MRALAHLVISAAVAACTPSQDRVSTMKVTTSSAVISSLAGHKTYAYEATAPPPQGSMQWPGAPAAVEVVKQRIDAEMQARGYVLDPNPEVAVRISIGTKKTIEEPKGSAALHNAPVSTNDVFDLHIDVFDRANGGHLFHGSAQDELHTREPDPNKLAKAVRLILEPVPPAAR